jgi:hypothetical protein
VGKRQLDALAEAAATDVAGFYAQRELPACPDADLLVLTFDGKGIVMRPEALREATAKVARTAGSKLATRLSPGEKQGRKRMAELAGVYDATPEPRTPSDVISRPGQPRTGKTGPRAAASGWPSASPRTSRPSSPLPSTRPIAAIPTTADPGSPSSMATPPDRGHPGPSDPPPGQHHHRLGLHPRPGILMESRLIVLLPGRSRRRSLGRQPGNQDPRRQSSHCGRRDPPPRHPL